MKGRLPWPMLCAAACITVILGLPLISSKTPWCDEGWFAFPAHQMAFHGGSGTTVLEPTGHYLEKRLDGIQRRTLVVPPLQLWMLSIWYRLFGPGLDSGRVYGLLWGAGGILVLGWIVHWTWRNPFITLLAASFTSVDLVYLWASADARMDIQSAVLSWMAWLLYLRFRKRNLYLAVFLSHIAFAAAALHHLNTMYAMLGLWLVALRLDWRGFRLRHLVACSLPFVAAGIVWAAYINPDFDLFQIQFGANAAGRSNIRSRYILEPWINLCLEIYIRYGTTYGLRSIWLGELPRIYLGMPILFAVIAALAAWKRKRLVRGRGAILFVLIAVQLLSYTFLTSFKSQVYLVGLVPLWNILLAWLTWHFWTSRDGAGHWPKYVAAALAGVFFLMQGSACVYKIRESERTHGFLAARQRLDSIRRTGDSIWAPTYWGLETGFTGYREDNRLGFYTGARSTWLVRDHFSLFMDGLLDTDEPAVHAHVQRLLRDEYTLVARFGEYRIYRRKEPDKPNEKAKEKALDTRSDIGTKHSYGYFGGRGNESGSGPDFRMRIVGNRSGESAA